MKNRLKAVFKNLITKTSHTTEELALAAKLLGSHFYQSNQQFEGDFVVAAYPKSGNTLMQNIICSCRTKADPLMLPDRLVQELCPDLQYKKIYKRIFEPTCFKFHGEPFSFVQHLNVIHLIRNPYDFAASFYFFQMALGDKRTEEEIIMADSGIKGWIAHYRKWRHVKCLSYTQIKYEDLYLNGESVVNDLSMLLNLKLSRSDVSRVVEGNRIENARKKELDTKHDNPAWNRRKRKDIPFARRGKPGGGREELSKQTIKKITEYLEPFESDLPYELEP